MSYYKRTTQYETFYYSLLDPIIMIMESSTVYRVSEADHDEIWIKSNAEEIDEEEYNDKADNISTYARIGTHPPCPPGGCA